LFRIDPAIFEVFPDVRIGVVCAHGLDNRGDSAEITARIRQAETSLVEAFEGASVTEHPRIAPWREAYRKFGAKPKKYPSSIESLARRALRGDNLRPINKLVDIYNFVSLRHVMPVGGEDLDRIEGDILLTYAGESEVPVKLLGESEERPPVSGEVIYKDDGGAICRRWNWKEADRTKLTEDTRNAVLVIESLPPVGPDELETAAGELADLIKNHCRGKTLVSILDSQRSSVELSSP
jgi:lysyl-tRNA synthetase class 2